MDCSVLGFPVLHHLPEFTQIHVHLLKLMSIELVMPSNHFILCCPLLLLPSIFPSIRVFFATLGRNMKIFEEAPHQMVIWVKKNY